MTELEHVEDQAETQNATTVPATLGLLTITDQISFYCDCYWDFLRSTLDILAQLINELQPLDISERDVDFKRVADKVNLTMTNSRLDIALRELRNSQVFKQLEEYRHCSTHRRPVYIGTQIVTTAISGTPGYDAGTSVQRTITGRYLCINPWDRTPRINGGARPVVAYTKALLEKIENRIDKILNSLS